MGTAKEKYLLTCFFIGYWSWSCAQGAAVVEKISIDELNGQVFLNWTIEAGGTCNGIGVQRSTDAISFYEIGSLEGVCGNLSFPTDYEFTDEAPELNAENFYRLDLGGSGYSEVVSVFVIDLSVQNYAFFPMPLTNCSQLYFRNDALREASLSVFDSKGRLVLLITAVTETFTIDRSSLKEEGLYFFNIQLEGVNEMISGKILVN